MARAVLIRMKSMLSRGYEHHLHGLGARLVHTGLERAKAGDVADLVVLDDDMTAWRPGVAGRRTAKRPGACRAR